MSRELVLLLSGLEAGVVVEHRGRLELRYSAEWRQTAGAFPLSMSMPLAVERHTHQVVEAFLWGLLPDNELIVERWARNFQVSARTPFGLLSHVGEDCPGAVQLVCPERVATVRETPGAVTWLSEADVAERLSQLRTDISAWRKLGDGGQFSLAGAQPKTALLLQAGRWGVPSGRRPTTHILKPGIPELDGSAENEHFCLALAGKLGLPVAKSEVRRFGKQVAIVVERYDRVRSESEVQRVHQEDLCQALGVHPARKYQNEGGPAPTAIVELLREHSQRPAEDEAAFVDALIFNWLIAGPDAHAKNYSLLVGRAGRVRLAPLYDLASALPYQDMPLQKLKLAMKVGGKYRIRDVGRRQWEKLAQELGREPAALVDRARELAEAAETAAPEVLAGCRAAGLRHKLLSKLSQRLVERATRCRAALA